MSTQRRARTNRLTRSHTRAASLSFACSAAMIAGLLAPSGALAQTQESAVALSPATSTRVASPTNAADLDVMFVGAHPDDEAGRLSVYGEWAETYGAKVGVVTVTRGEGGGNAVGPEEGPALGLIREREERQAVARGGISDVYNLDDVDFYYTVSEPLTREAWSTDSLEKLVRVIRMTTPEIVVTMDPAPTPGNHGQHQEAALLALEAYRIAGDPGAFPKQIADEGLAPWTVKKIFLNNARGSAAGRGETCPTVFTPQRPTQNIYGVWAGRTSTATGTTWAQTERLAQRQYASQGWTGFSDAPSDPTQIACDYLVQVDSRVPYTRGDLSPTAADPSTMLQGALLPAAGGLPLGTGLEFTGADFQVVPGQSTVLTATVTAPSSSSLSNVVIQPTVPAGWTVTPAQQPISSVDAGSSVSRAFTVIPPASASATNSRFLVSASVTSDQGAGYSDREFEVVPPVRGSQQLLPQVSAFQQWAQENDYPQMEGFVKPVLTLASGGERTVSIDVRNFSDSAQAGSVTLNLPAGFSADAATKTYSGLAGGASTSIDFVVRNTDASLATSNQGGDYDYTVTTVAGAVSSQTPGALELVPATAVGAAAAPTLDGVIAAGEYVTGPLDIGRLWEGAACDSAADCGGEAYLTRSGDDIYIAVKVIDDTLGTVLPKTDCKRHWRTDSVEIAIDPDGTSENTSTTFKAYVFPTTQGSGACFGRDADNRQGEGNLVAPGMEVASSVSSPYAGYVVETKIPASALPHTIDPEHMGLNLFVYDSDTQDLTGQTRLGWSTWGGVQGDPYRWGTASFPGWTPPAVSTQSPLFGFAALSSLASPQSIEQSVRTGVPLAGKPAAAADKAASAVWAWPEAGVLQVALDARSAGKLRLFALADDGSVVGSSESRVDQNTRRLELNAPGAQRVVASFAADSGGSTASAVSIADARITSDTQVALSVPSVEKGRQHEAQVTVSSKLLAPTGTVELRADGTIVGSVDLASGVAKFDLTNQLSAGEHLINASYLGSDVMLPSSSSALVTVTATGGETQAEKTPGQGIDKGGAARTGGGQLGNTGSSDWTLVILLGMSLAAGGILLRSRNRFVRR